MAITKWLPLMWGLFSWLPTFVSASEVRGYLRFNGAASLNMLASEDGTAVLGSENSSSRPPPSIGLQYRTNDGDVATVLEFDNTRQEQSLVKYAPLSFGPLLAFIPVSTRDALSLTEVSIRYKEEHSRRVSANLSLALIYGATLMHSKISILGERDFSASGYLPSGLAGLRLNYYHDSIVPIFVEYTIAHSVTSTNLSHHTSSLAFGSQVYKGASTTVDVTFFSSSGSYSYKKVGRNVGISSSSSGLQIGFSFK